MIGQHVFAAILTVSLALWSVVPAATHAPAVFETIQDHLAMIDDHGHSHGFEEDLYWAMHGHGHDTADHDHSQATLLRATGESPALHDRAAWRFRSVPAGPSRIFRIERPPRA